VGTDLPGLLAVLADAADALARLDARVATAADAVRAGLLARLALTEAAGLLAHAHAWVHPLDLALRDAGLTAPAALAALGAGARVLPHTIAQPVGRLGWEDPPLGTLPEIDQGVADALAVARLLRRLPGGGPHPFGTAVTTAETLTALGARELDPGRLAAWWEAHAPAPAPPRRFGGRRGEGVISAVARGRHCRPGLDGERHHRADPACSCRSGAPTRRSASDRDALPTLRADAADRVAGRGHAASWPVACLHLIAESARLGLRELNRIEAAAVEKGRGLATRSDKRSRLPDALDALLR
jgi:hypothetical protein